MNGNAAGYGASIATADGCETILTGAGTTCVNCEMTGAGSTDTHGAASTCSVTIATII